MRLGDGTDLLGVNDPRSASIGIIRVDPTDVRQDVLTAILAQDELNRKQIVIVLHEQNKAFQRPVDFDGLKDMRRTLKAELVIVARNGSGSAEFARQRRFPVFSSLESFASTLQAAAPVEESRRGWFSRRQKNGAATDVIDQRQPLPLLFPDPAPGGAASTASAEGEHEKKPGAILPIAGVAAGAIGAAAVGDAFLDHDVLAPAPPKSAANGMGAAPTNVGKTADATRSADPKIIRLGKPTDKLPVMAPEAVAGAATVSEKPAPKPTNNGSSNRRRAALAGGALAAGALGAAAYSAAQPQVSPGGSPPGGGTTGSQGGGGGGGGGRRRRRTLLALILVLLTLLLLAGIALASPPGQQVIQHVLPGSTTTATVTITPDSQDIVNTYAITAVTGTPNAAKRQVQARIISVKSPSASASAHASGSIPGKKATGTLVFANLNGTVTIPGGTLTSKSGAVIAFNTITVPFGSAQEIGIAVSAGVSGDIPANNISYTFSNGVVVKNPFAFTGGVNPIPNAVITQNDIATATNSLIGSVKKQAQSELQGQVHANENVVANTLSCKANVTANHKVGDVAPTVMVTGTATCSEEVYDRVGAQQLASTLLSAMATQKLGSVYAPAQNKIVAGVTQATVIDASQSVALLVHAEGIWVYQFSAQYKQLIATAIANKSETDAMNYLKAQAGVRDVSISISSGTTLPAANNITIIINNVSGPTATPTLMSGSPTPTVNTGQTPTPTPTPQNGQGGS